ncbi:MAG TPA: hypothetical protein VEV37_10960, partial [Bryobacteraceae bacterium]|nr:hypothetical protein [Bryobacteraceae bacterium]
MSASPFVDLLKSIEHKEPENPSPDSRAPASTEEQAIVPPIPETVDESGIPASILEHLMLKLLYTRGEMLGRDLSEAMGLKFSLIEDFLEYLKHQHLIQAKTSLG